MRSWKLVFTKQAQKDAHKLAKSGMKERAEFLLNLLQNDPFQTPPPFEKLIGNLSGTISRRINIQHRLVYQVFGKQKIVKVIRMWTHYE